MIFVLKIFSISVSQLQWKPPNCKVLLSSDVYNYYYYYSDWNCFQIHVNQSERSYVCGEEITLWLVDILYSVWFNHFEDPGIKCIISPASIKCSMVGNLFFTLMLVAWNTIRLPSAKYLISVRRINRPWISIPSIIVVAYTITLQSSSSLFNVRDLSTNADKHLVSMN